MTTMEQSVAEELRAARQAADQGDDAAARGRPAAAYEAYDNAAESFGKCSQVISDEGTSALFTEMAASCRELANLQRRLSMMSSSEKAVPEAESAEVSSQQKRQEGEDGTKTAALETEVQQLKHKLRLVQQKNKLLHNQQQLMLDISARLVEAKSHYEHQVQELRTLLFDQVTDPSDEKEESTQASSTSPQKPSSRQSSSSSHTAATTTPTTPRGGRSAARIERLRSILTQRTKERVTPASELAASLIQAHVLTPDDLANFKAEAQRFGPFAEEESSDEHMIESRDASTDMLTSVSMAQRPPQHQHTAFVDFSSPS